MGNIDLKNFFTFHGQFVLRTPFLPFKASEQFPENENSIKLLFSGKEFQEAVCLASPVLYEKFEKWIQNQLPDQQEKQNLFQSLHKYCTRMQTRCTPYGLFAGCSVGFWDKENNILLGDAFRHTRLDMDILCDLSRKLSQENILKNHLNFFPNNSIYTVGEQLRYVEYQSINNNRSYQISSVDNNIYLKELLEFAENGATIPQLIHFLVNNGILKEKASKYIEELVDEQLLQSEIEPNVTGEEYTGQLIKKLTALNYKIQSEEIADIINTLTNILAKIEMIDGVVGNNIDLYKEIIINLQDLKIESRGKIFFQTDLFKNTKEASIDRSIQNELYKVINFLNKIYPANINTNLEVFKNNYLTRYDNAEMPLLQVLDTENGIGYLRNDNTGINILLEGLNIPMNSKNESDIRINDATEILFRKFIKAQKENKYKIQLSDDDFKGIDYTTDNLPPTMYVFFNIINKNTNKIYLQNYGNGIDLIGRFTHGNKDIHAIATQLSKHEQQLYPNQIFAEIVHLPENRTGNILRRQIFGDYEIPYLAVPSVDKKYQIKLKDLFIKIVDGRIIIKSKKLNKEIIPRLSSAHNFSFNALPAYYFLCDLQTQYYEKSTIGFMRDGLYRLFSFTPRVEYSNTILSPATWHLKKADFEEILNIDSIDFEKKVKCWKVKWNIPNLICLAEGDNKLLINTKDNFSVKVLIKAIKNMEAIYLTEFLFEAQNSLVNDENNNVYPNECIAFLTQTKVDNSKQNNIVISGLNNENNQKIIKRRFVTGEEWLYYKIYCGIKTADKILIEIINPLIAKLTNEKLISNWFFVRYNDPDLHIRLRLKLVDVNSLSIVIHKLNLSFRPYLEANLIHKLLTDTYVRELERYGDRTIEEVEQFFQIDSDTTIEMLSLVRNCSDENIRWLYALRCTDDMLNAFSLNIIEKAKLLGSLFNSFFTEHNGNKELKIQLDIKYRKYKDKIQLFMCPDESSKKEFSDIFQLLNKKNILVNTVANEIIALRAKHELQANLNSFLSSLVHMMLNRIFMGRQRTNELVIYDMLNRYYKSQIARSKIKL